MQQIIPLSDLPNGQSATIQHVMSTGAMYERLCDLGFTPGSSVVCLFSSIFGNPRAYRIKQTIIALRQEDAVHVECALDGGEA